MPTTSEADTEAWVLTTEAGRDLLAAVAAVAVPKPADLTRWRTLATPEQTAAALRISQSRRRGAAKFSRADRMWFASTALEQATAEPVARHKARRFSGQTMVDLCCGIGGDTLALASMGNVLAVDTDQGNLRRALWNAGVYQVESHIAAVRARAESFVLPRGAWVHIDPDRRAGSRRARDLEGYQPGLEFLHDLTRKSPGGAIKLGPASDFSEHFASLEFEIELISLGGECKEATVWYGEAGTCRRRATRLPEAVTWTDDDAPAGQFAVAGPVLRWVFDPDPALIRAGLLDGFATSHGLTRVVDGVDYLTAPDRVDSPFLAAFEVIASLPLDLKRLRHEVASRGLGPLEVKTRGIALSPEQVRAHLRPPGGVPATLLLAGGKGSPKAILARRPS